MGRSRPPRKPYRAKSPAGPMPTRVRPWLLESAFGPLEEILRHIQRDGTLIETERGALVYQSAGAGKVYEVVAAIGAYADIFAVLRSRDAQGPDPGPLLAAARQLAAGQVSERDIESALACLAAMRAYTEVRPPALIAEAAQTVALRAYLDVADKHRSEAQSPSDLAAEPPQSGSEA